MKKLVWILLVIMTACSIETESINYGKEACSYCQMVIVDNRHGSELITDKGKIFKFDALECMINFKNKEAYSEEDIHSLWTNVYLDDGDLYDVHQCVFLRSNGLPSPMGMYLNAFKKKETAEQFKNEHGGTIYSWTELNDQFDKLPSVMNMK